MKDIYVCVIFLRVKIYWMFFIGATFSMFTFRIVRFSCVRFSLTPLYLYNKLRSYFMLL